MEISQAPPTHAVLSKTQSRDEMPLQDTSVGPDQDLQQASHGLQLTLNADDAHNSKGHPRSDHERALQQVYAQLQHYGTGSHQTDPAAAADAAVATRPVATSESPPVERNAGTVDQGHGGSGRTQPPLGRQLCQQWLEAAKEGDLPMLQKLFNQHPDLLDYQPPGGLQCSALHWAAARGHPDVLDQLLMWGADMSLLTATRSTCLHSAAAANQRACVDVLLTVPSAAELVDAVNEDGLTAAALAGKHGHTIVQDLLLSSSASEPGMIDTSWHEQFIDAPAAVTTSQVVAKQQPKASGLRSGFFNTNSKSSKPSKQDRAVPAAPTAAAQGGRSQPQKSNSIQQPVHASGILPAAAAPEPNSSNSQSCISSSTGRSWLDASRQGDLHSMQSLLASQPELLQYSGKGTSYAFTGNSALHWAAAKGHVDVVQWLLLQGVDVQQANEAGETALHTAVGHKQPACAQLLVHHGGADVNMQDGLGQSSVQVAHAARDQTLAAKLQLWDLMKNLKTADRSSWSVQQMQHLLRLAGKSADAAACVERQDLVQLTQQVLEISI